MKGVVMMMNDGGRSKRSCAKIGEKIVNHEVLMTRRRNGFRRLCVIIQNDVGLSDTGQTEYRL